jgi:hypothetical protein
MPSQQASPAEHFLEAIDISVTELAALRGVSRQYATRDLGNFLKSAESLTDLCRTLLVINTDSSRAMADRLKKFAAEELKIPISVGTTVSAANSKTFSEIVSENKELWVWATSPLDVERTAHWEKLCTGFLDKEGRLLVYFVPSLEIADRLALRFETELFSRQYDYEGRPLSNHEGFGATVFIVVTSLAATMPYVVLANPGSGDVAKSGLSSSVWAMGKQAQDLFELPSRYGDHLVQKARAAGLGVARSSENFFPLGEALKRESGVPFSNYPNVDPLIGIRLEHSIGLFEGDPLPLAGGRIDDAENQTDETGYVVKNHPLKFFPVFIKAYRRKPGELSRRPPPPQKKKYFNF